MTDVWAQLASGSISNAAEMIKNDWMNAAQEQMRPCVMFKPTLSRDGSMWRALFGINLVEGVAGFGETPAAAMYAFDSAWYQKSGSCIIEPKDKSE